MDVSMVSLIPRGLWHPIFSFIVLGITLILVPRTHVRRLFLVSLLWGVLFSWVMTWLLIRLGFFRFEYSAPFVLAGVPIWKAFGWSPSTMLFLYFKPPLKRALLFAGYVITFSLISAMVDATFHGLGLIAYLRWSPFARFLLSILWAVALTFYCEVYIRQKPVTDAP